MPDGATKSKTAQRIEPELFLKKWRDISDRARDRDEAKAAWKEQLESAGASGIDLQALKQVERMMKMEPARAQEYFRNQILYLAWMGLKILEQEDAFDNMTSTLTAKVVEEHKVWQAEHDGYDEGKNGHPVDNNPFTPGSANHQAWARGWNDGAEDRKTTPPAAAADDAGSAEDAKPKGRKTYPEEGDAE